MAEDEAMPPFERRLGNTPVSNDVLAYQLGTFKESLDRGLGSLEKSLEKGLDAVALEVKELNGRVSLIERRQEFDAARLKALEQYREEMDRAEALRQDRIQKERDAAVDNSQMWKTGRWVAGGVLFIATLAGIIAGIANSM